MVRSLSAPAVATLFNSGLRDFDALTPEQHTQFAFLMAELIGTWEIAHQEFESGVVDESPLQRAASSHAVFLRTPGGRKWWDRYRSSYPPGFQQYVGTQIDNQTD